MRLIAFVSLPPEPFNSLVADGVADQKIREILEEIRPEAAYFTTYDNGRSAILVHEVAEPSDIPRLAEPWFLTFEADIDFKPAMIPEDLARAGLEELGERWS